MLDIPPARFLVSSSSHVLKIEIAERPGELRLSLTGRISADHLADLGSLLAAARDSGRRVRLDLEAVTLAERQAVTFLAVGPGRVAQIDGCPAFLREWIDREAERSAEDVG